MYKILKQEGTAKRAEFQTVHGTVQTPVFMNVGTIAAIKGAVANGGSGADRNTDPAFQYVSSACASGRRDRCMSWADFINLWYGIDQS